MVLDLLAHVDAIDDLRVRDCLQVVNRNSYVVDTIEVAAAFVSVAGAVGFARRVDSCKAVLLQECMNGIPASVFFLWFTMVAVALRNLSSGCTICVYHNVVDAVGPCILAHVFRPGSSSFVGCTGVWCVCHCQRFV